MTNLSNERIQELIDNIPKEDAIWGMNTGHGSYTFDVYQLLIEIQDLRQQNAEWKQDAERLANVLDNWVGTYGENKESKNAFKHHNALMEKYGK